MTWVVIWVAHDSATKPRAYDHGLEKYQESQERQREPEARITSYRELRRIRVR